MTLHRAQCSVLHVTRAMQLMLYNFQACRHMQQMQKNLKAITPNVAPRCRSNKVMIALFKAYEDTRIVFVLPLEI